jgi:hypothetical protein
MDLREPKKVTIKDGEGRERKFILSKMTAWDGMEVAARLPANLAMIAVPKIGEWAIVKDLGMKVLKYVAVDIKGTPLPLTTEALQENHVGDWICLRDLIIAEVAYNNLFFPTETILSFCEKAFLMALGKVSEILNQSSAPSSPTTKQPSTNSEPFIP